MSQTNLKGLQQLVSPASIPMTPKQTEQQASEIARILLDLAVRVRIQVEGEAGARRPISLSQPKSWNWP